MAGVTYQVAVTAHLLLAARAGELPITKVVPEGLEDIDCVLSPDTWGTDRMLVQVKEHSQSAVVGRGEIADFLAHAIRATGSESLTRLALVTNGVFGSGVVASGWGKTATDVLDGAVRRDLQGAFGDLTQEQVEHALHRTHLLTVPFDVANVSALRVAELFEVSPSAARLVVARLLQELADAASAQRFRSYQRPIQWAATDLDGVVRAALLAVDPIRLDEVVRDGVIDLLDFRERSPDTPEEFLAGVDVRPWHIAAGLDIPRPTELTQVMDGLNERRLVLIVGPSGAGKSTLLWRVAYELAGRVRVYRIRSLTPGDVPRLLNYIDGQAPSDATPVLLCADDLGRASTGGWEAASDELLERPGVFLIGAAREEDFRMALARHRAAIVRPVLDEAVAAAIAQTLELRGVIPRLAPAEAFQLSERLLMEFLSLLVTGERLAQVVGQQAETLLSPERVVEREALRYVCAADVLGVDLSSQAIGALVPRPEALPKAMDRLKNEHLVVESATGHWSGLHELRSVVLTNRLHASPPPTTAETFAELLPYLLANERHRILPRAARRTSDDLEPLVSAVADLLNHQDMGALEAARLLEGLAYAEAIRHAADCLPVVDLHKPAHMATYDVLWFAAAERFAGVKLSMIPHSWFRQLVSRLPDPPVSLRGPVLEEAGGRRIVDLASRAKTEDAIRLFEALEGAAWLESDWLREVYEAHRGAPARQVASLIATTSVLNPGGLEELIPCLGGVEERLQALADEHRAVLDWHVSDGEDGRIASIQVIMPLWKGIDAHAQAVEVARLGLDLCPEVEVVEVVTLAADGGRYAFPDHEPAYKRLSRSGFPRHPRTSAIPILLQAARQLTAADYWTERLRAQAGAFAELRAVLVEVPQRLLNPHDNPRRRSNWVAAVGQLSQQVAAVPGQPMEETDPSADDHAVDALRAASVALQQLASWLDGGCARLVGMGVLLREAIEHLGRACAAGSPLLVGVGEPLPRDATSELALAADLVFALAEEHEASGLERDVRRGVETWVDAARRVTTECKQRRFRQEQATIRDALALAGISGVTTAVREGERQVPRLVPDRWIVRVEAEQWDGGAFMQYLPPDVAEQLAFRLVAIPSRLGGVIPVGGIYLGASRLFPADAKLLTEICQLAGLELLETGVLQITQSVLGLLHDASALAAAARLGRRTATDAELLSSARDGLLRARRLLDDISASDVREVCSELVEVVASELDGGLRDGMAAQFAAWYRDGIQGSIVEKASQAIWAAALAATSS